MSFFESLTWHLLPQSTNLPMINKEQQLGILVNNAGVFMLPLRRSVDGVEMHFAVNYLGHFLLTNLLLKHLEKAPSARIVSIAATWINGINFDDINSEKSYNCVMAVIQGKQAQLLQLSTCHLLLRGQV